MFKPGDLVYIGPPFVILKGLAEVISIDLSIDSASVQILNGIERVTGNVYTIPIENITLVTSFT